jgi:hypothetical protein
MLNWFQKTIKSLTLQSALAFGIISSVQISAADGVPTVPPDFQSVYRLVQEHLTTRDRDELNRISLEALLKSLPDEVTLTDLENEAASDTSLIPRSNIYQGVFAYIRISKISAGLKDQLLSKLNTLKSGATFAGIALDLRFASGSDYNEAASVVDLYLAGGSELIDWGEGMITSTETQPLLGTPTIILVNSKTSVAAEALAAMLKSNKIGVVVGSPTAGHALAYKEFLLQNGQRLRIASGRVKLPEYLMTNSGVEPDLTVVVEEAEELNYMEDEYYSPDGESPRRINEADLERMKQQELSGTKPSEKPGEDLKAVKTPENSSANLIRDPALALAIDILKASAIYNSK